MEDIPENFVGSRDWIGSVEVELVLDQFCDVPCKIFHSRSGRELENVFDQVEEHFRCRKCPIMMGGNLDCSSKGIFGACRTISEKYFLLIDPHFGRTSISEITAEELVSQGWAQWVLLENFNNRSFYNLCLPQVSL